MLSYFLQESTSVILPTSTVVISILYIYTTHHYWFCQLPHISHPNSCHLQFQQPNLSPRLYSIWFFLCGGKFKNCPQDWKVTTSQLKSVMIFFFLLLSIPKDTNFHFILVGMYMHSITSSYLELAYYFHQSFTNLQLNLPNKQEFHIKLLIF